MIVASFYILVEAALRRFYLIHGIDNPFRNGLSSREDREVMIALRPYLDEVICDEAIYVMHLGVGRVRYTDEREAVSDIHVSYACDRCRR